jgi:hypothetical protein
MSNTHLQAHEHTGLPVACVSVVEQSDIPRATCIQEPHQSAWPLREDHLCIAIYVREELLLISMIEFAALWVTMHMCKLRRCYPRYFICFVTVVIRTEIYAET